MYHEIKMPRAKRLAVCFSLVLAVVLIYEVFSTSELGLGDALFLTKNSIRENGLSVLCKNGILCGQTTEKEDSGNQRSGLRGLDLELDSPFTNVMNSVFPIDLVISYNYSNETFEMIARYASFSPIINRPMTAEYAIVPGFACEGPWSPENRGDYEDKILIVLRGKCTFVKKILNLLDSDLRPRAIIVANDEPYRALLTMYLASFNADGKLTSPILFILNEDYRRLKDLQSLHLKLVIRTATFDNWINLLLSMAVSPPLLILLSYLFIRTIQVCRKKRVSKLNERLVKNLPVYIYHRNHLVPALKFYNYLTSTHQTNNVPLPPSSSDDVASVSEPELPASMKNFVVNGTDLFLLRKTFGLLFAPEDFFPTFKCSICLDKFVPLQLRVLVLECHHLFHEKCLSNWLINFRRSCPLCNNTIRPSENLPLLNSPLAPIMTQQLSFDYGTMERELGIHRLCSSHFTTSTPRQLPDLTSTAAVRSLQIEPISSENPENAGVNGPSSESAQSECSFMTSLSQPPMLRATPVSSISSAYFTPSQSHEGNDGIEEILDRTYADSTDGDRSSFRLSTQEFSTPTNLSPSSVDSSSLASTICMN